MLDFAFLSLDRFEKVGAGGTANQTLVANNPKPAPDSLQTVSLQHGDRMEAPEATTLVRRDARIDV